MNETRTLTTQLQGSSSDMPIVRPTKKQKELLEYIDAFIVEHGYSPSYREIMQGLNYTSVATVALHVKSLIQRGHLRKRDHSARSLEVVTKPEADQVAPLRTNQVKEAEEKWLVGKVEALFAAAEAQAAPTVGEYEDLAILLATFKVLGLEGAAQSFAARLKALREKVQA